MKPHVRPPLRTAAGLIAATFLVGACASTPTPTPTPTPTLTPVPTPTAVPTLTLTPAPSPTAAPSPSATPSPTAVPIPSAPPATGDPFSGVLPLPPDLQLPAGDIAVAPQSPRGMAMGVAMPYDLGHCGLYSPVDLDGSLWEPVGAVDRKGGPIDTDQEVGQLINGTPGEVLLVAAGRLDWRATQGARVVVVFRRLPGERAYPGCM